jgi:hypothetical protein
MYLADLQGRKRLTITTIILRKTPDTFREIVVLIATTKAFSARDF